MSAGTSDLGKQHLIESHGAIAGELYDLVCAVHPSLASYLVASWLDTPLPGNVDRRRRQAMRIGALSTLGRCGDEFRDETSAALAANMSPAEVVEVVVHTIPYAGIPKPLNALFAVEGLFDERSLLPVALLEPTWQPSDRMNVGLDRIAYAHPAAAPALQENLALIAPSLYDYIVAAAFGDIYGRPGLNYAQRQPITIVALTAQGDVQNHVRTHINGALNIGMDPKTIVGALVDIVPLVAPDRVLETMQIASEIFAEREALAGDYSATPDW